MVCSIKTAQMSSTLAHSCVIITQKKDMVLFLYIYIFSILRLKLDELDNRGCMAISLKGKIINAKHEFNFFCYLFEP